MDPSERELHLRFDARELRDLEAGRLTRRVAQQRGLSDARFSANDQGLAAALVNPGEQSIEDLALCGPAHEPRPKGAGHG
jgi:hypothetical protein